MSEETKKLNVVVVLGTTHEGRSTERVAKYLAAQVDAREDMQSMLYDVRDLVYDGNNEGTSIRDANPRWRDMVVEADALLIVTPEYNHGYPGSLKLTLDTLYPEYQHKAVGMAGVSSGAMGGGRVIENLTPVVRKLSMYAIKPSLYFPKAAEAFDEHGEAVDPATPERVTAFLDELAWLATALRWGREHLR